MRIFSAAAIRQVDTDVTIDGVSVSLQGEIDVGVTYQGRRLRLTTTRRSPTAARCRSPSSNTLDVEDGPTGSGASLYGVSVINNGAIVIGATSYDPVLVLYDDTAITGGTLTVGIVQQFNSVQQYGAVAVETGASDGGPGPGFRATLDGVAVTDNYNIAVGEFTSGAVLTLDDGTSVTGGGTGTLTIGSAPDTGGGTGVVDIEAGFNGPGSGATLDGVGVIDNGALDIGDVSSGAVLTLEDSTTVVGGGVGTLTINADTTLDIETGANDGPTHGATLDSVAVTNNGNIEIGVSPPFTALSNSFGVEGTFTGIHQ